MWQLIVSVLLTVAFVAFGMANAHRVTVELIFGEPIEIRLIFLLVIAFVGGFLTVALRQMAVRAVARRRDRRARLRRALASDLKVERVEA